jgi:hypothetical protein
LGRDCFDSVARIAPFNLRIKFLSSQLAIDAN